MSFQEINVYGAVDNAVSQADNNYAVNKLNGMLKLWGTDGVKAPKRRIGYVFMQLGQNAYNLGTISGSDHCTNIYHQTTLSASYPTTTTVINVASSTGMSVGDNIGIILDTGSLYWTTIATINSSTQITLTSGLTSSATSGNIIYAYTSNINRPLSILYATNINAGNNNTEVEVNVFGHDEYNKLPNKTLVGAVNECYYNKVIYGARPNYSKLHVYPQPNVVTQVIKIIYVDELQDMANSTDDLDLPSEWLYPVMWNLAVELAYSYGKLQEIQVLQPKADAMYELIKNASYDGEPITFKIKMRR